MHHNNVGFCPFVEERNYTRHVRAYRPLAIFGKGENCSSGQSLSYDRHGQWSTHDVNRDVSRISLVRCAIVCIWRVGSLMSAYQQMTMVKTNLPKIECRIFLQVRPTVIFNRLVNSSSNTKKYLHFNCSSLFGKNRSLSYDVCLHLFFSTTPHLVANFQHWH